MRRGRRNAVPKKSILNIAYPAAGLHRGAGYQTQPPYTTPDVLNVRPRETLKGRERGGSRPGLVKAYNTILGSGNPVRMLGSIAYLNPDALTIASDQFEGAALSSTLWSAATWIDASLPSILPDSLSVSYNMAQGAVRTALPNFDTTLPYEIDVWVAPYNGSHNGKYQIFGGMNNTTPVATTDGFVAELVMEDATGAYSGTLKVYIAGGVTSYALTSGTTTLPMAGWFSVMYTPSTRTAVVSWCGVTLLSQVCAFGGGGSAMVGTRVGFGLNCTVAGGLALVDEFRVQYATNAKIQTLVRPIVASSNGLLYKESFAGTMAQVSTTQTLAGDRQLQCAEHGMKLYIADHGNPRGTGTTGTVTTLVLDDAAVSSWNALGIDSDDDVVVISAATGAGTTLGTFTILGVHNTNGVTMQATSGVTPADSTNTVWRIERAPKVYDPVAGTLTLWVAASGKGQVPTGCPLFTIWRDRPVFAGAPVAPYVWYAGRQGVTASTNLLDDFYYGDLESDGGRAVAGTNVDSGSLADEITALAPWSDDYLLFGCPKSLWVLRGDPAYGGMITNLSYHAGIADKRAWCFGPAGEFVFLSWDGLYMMAPGASTYPVCVSTTIPRELQNIDRATTTVNLAYDARDRGVHIFLSPGAGDQQLHWWFDLAGRGFWPVRIPSANDPFCAFEYAAAAASNSCVLMGGRNGVITRFHPAQENDDGTAISSYVLLGPIRLGSDYHDGLVNEILTVLGKNSAGLTASVHVADTAEAAVDAAARESKTLTAGLNYTWRPRARGGAMCIKLTGLAASRAWACERVTAVLERLGKQRKL